MKRLYPLILLLLAAGCSKEKKQEDLVIQAMVNGQWKVTSFNDGSSDRTADFTGYSFQFKTNLTVDAINGSSIQATGTWNADAAAQTITSNFASGVSPLVLLNGTWTITNNSWTWVEARQTVNGSIWTLRLDKL